MSTSGPGLRSTIPPTNQAYATINQANPVSGTKYEVLPTTKNCRIINFYVQCIWTVQPTPLELHILIDNVQHTFSFPNPVSTTDYWFSYFGVASPAAGALATTLADISRTFIIEGKSVKVEAEISGGTVQNLICRVIYAKW